MPVRMPRWSLASRVVAFAAVTALAAVSTAGEPAAQAGAGRTVPPVVGGDAQTILQAIQRPGAKAVLVNVWATWCDACREEMPRLVRFFREHRAGGLRLILISADEDSEREQAAQFLAAQGVDVPSWLKRGDDMAFIDALDRRWTGTLPASLLFDGKGRVIELWQGPVTVAELDRAWARVSAPKTSPPPPPSPQPSAPKRRNP
jgi:thiol-disulfide isomerase/thioredoxin